MRFRGLYGDMKGIAMAGSSRWVCGGRIVSFVPACQLPDLHVLPLLASVVGRRRWVY